MYLFLHFLGLIKCHKSRSEQVHPEKKVILHTEIQIIDKPEDYKFNGSPTKNTGIFITHILELNLNVAVLEFDPRLTLQSQALFLNKNVRQIYYSFAKQIKNSHKHYYSFQAVPSNQIQEKIANMSNELFIPSNIIQDINWIYALISSMLYIHKNDPIVMMWEGKIKEDYKKVL